MNALQKLDINQAFAACLFVEGRGGQYGAPEGWYPLLGLPGSLDVEAHAVLFCKLQGPVEARPDFRAAWQASLHRRKLA